MGRRTLAMILGTLAVIAAGGSDGRWAEAAADLGTVIIGKANDTIGLSVADIAEHEGYFEHRGVHVQIVVLGNSTVANSALIAGNVQFTGASASALLLARAKGLPFLAVAQTATGSPLQLVVGKKLLASAGVTRRTPLKRRLEALQNAVLAVTGPTDHGAYNTAFRAVGVAPHARFVVLRNQAAAAAAVENGQADAFFASPPSVFQIVAKGVGEILLSGSEIPGWGDAVYNVVITLHSYVQAHPDTVRAVAQAIGAGDEFVRAHREATLVILGQHFRGLGRPVLAQSLQVVTFAEHGRMTQQQWDAARQIAVAEQFVPESYQVREGLDWTNAYSQEQ